MAKTATRPSKKTAAAETPVVTTVTTKVPPPPAPTVKTVSCAPQGAPVAGIAPLTACKTRKPTFDQISARAHDIWVRKGKPCGQDETNWLEAEKELLGA